METQDIGRSQVVYLNDQEIAEMIAGLSQMLVNRGKGLINPWYEKGAIHTDITGKHRPSSLKIILASE